MKLIPLSSGGHALIDDRDYFRVNAAGPWRMTARGIVNRNGFLRRFLVSGPNIRHVNGCRFDCRRSNLQACTRSQLARSNRVVKQNTSGVTGVSRNARGSWEAYLVVRGERVLYRRCRTKQKAIEARQAAELIYHGKYRRQVHPCPNRQCLNCTRAA